MVDQTEVDGFCRVETATNLERGGQLMRTFDELRIGHVVTDRRDGSVGMLITKGDRFSTMVIEGLRRRIPNNRVVPGRHPEIVKRDRRLRSIEQRRMEAAARVVEREEEIHAKKLASYVIANAGCASLLGRVIGKLRQRQHQLALMEVIQ